MGKGKTVLVTGGCGFIGSHLVEALAGRGSTVRVLDNLSSGSLDNVRSLEGKIDVRRGDIRDPAMLEACCAGVEAVFHLAAMVSVVESTEKPVLCHEINLTGTLNVLEAAHRCGARRVILSSTCAVYGDDPGLPKTEAMPPNPISPYALAKLSGEQYAKLYSTLFGLPTIPLRYFNVFGPRQSASSPYSGVISRWMECFRTGTRPVVFGDGRQTRDFVYVSDVVAANLCALDAASAVDGPFNIATGRSVTLLEVLQSLGGVFGRKLEPVFRDPRPGDIRESAADITRATTTLGFSPSFDLDRGLRAMVRPGEGA